jgi:hypothetical protein
MSQVPSRKRERVASRHEAARDAALALPGVEEGTSYGTPAFRVRDKLFARFHQDGESLVVRASFDAREVLIQGNPKCFYVTDHYRAHPWVLVKLSAVSRTALREVLEQAWREQAPDTLVEQLEAMR